MHAKVIFGLLVPNDPFSLVHHILILEYMLCELFTYERFDTELKTL